jgi:hypothetical protein
MSNHFPECMEPQVDWPCKQCWEIDCECTCICERLRVCQQRILDAAISAAENQHMYMSDQPLIVTGFNVAKSEILRAIRALGIIYE